MGISYFLGAISTRFPSFSEDLVLFGSYFDKVPFIFRGPAIFPAFSWQVQFISRDLPSRDRITGRWRSFSEDLVLFGGFFSKVPFKAGDRWERKWGIRIFLYICTSKTKNQNHIEMKKVILAVFAALMSLSLSAQIYVGGSASFDAGSTTNKLNSPSTTIKTTNLLINPMVGYILSDNLSAGARLNIGFNTNTGANQKYFGFGINPFVRYELLEFGRFHILAEGGANFLTSATTTTYTNIGYDKDSTTTFGIYAEPVLTFDLTDQIALEAGLNCARLGFNVTGNKSITHNNNPAGDLTTRDDSDADFGLGVNGYDLIGTLGAITVGVTYKF